MVSPRPTHDTRGYGLYSIEYVLEEHNKRTVHSVGACHEEGESFSRNIHFFNSLSGGMSGGCSFHLLFVLFVYNSSSPSKREI
jgi:hypothetical protein